MTLRWGVLGTGGIASAFVRDLVGWPDARVVAGDEADARVVAVGSRSDASAREFGERHSVPHRHGSYAGLVEDAEVDAVYVATPHPRHARDALAAIAAGKHVLVEKPFTMDADEARAVVDAAREAGVFCMEAMWTRFLPHAVRIRELLADGALGDVRTVVADNGQPFEPDPHHRLFAPELGGGALLDLGVYPVSWASMVFWPTAGAPRSLVAASDPAFTGVDAQTSAVLQHAGGAHAVLTCSLAAATPRRASITGTAGRIEVEPAFYSPTTFTLIRPGVEPERFEPPAELRDGPGKGLRFEAAEVARRIAAGETESPVMSLDETVSIMQTMDGIRRAVGLTYPPTPPPPGA